MAYGTSRNTSIVKNVEEWVKANRARPARISDSMGDTAFALLKEAVFCPNFVLVGAVLLIEDEETQELSETSPQVMRYYRLDEIRVEFHAADAERYVSEDDAFSEVSLFGKEFETAFDDNSLKDAKHAKD